MQFQVTLHLKSGLLHIFVFLPENWNIYSYVSLETWELKQQRQKNKLSDFNTDPDWTSTIIFSLLIKITFTVKNKMVTQIGKFGCKTK